MAVYNTLLIKWYNFPIFGGRQFWFEALSVFKTFAAVIWILYFVFCLGHTFCKYFFVISFLMTCSLPFALVYTDLPLLFRCSTQMFNSFPYLFLDFTLYVRSIERYESSACS